MRILQINVTANSGSTGKIAEDIGRLVIDKGGQSYIAYGRTGNKSLSETIKIQSTLDKIIKGFNIKEHGLETRVLDNHGLASRLATRSFIKQIEEIKPDVIHLHNIHGYYINYKILFDYLAKRTIPIIWTLHDCWAFTGHCGYFDFSGCKKWKTGCYACACRKEYPASYVIDRCKKNYKDKKACFTSVKNMTIVAVSDWLGGLVKESFLKDYPVEVIHNGIDLNVFKPMETSNIKKKYHLEDKMVLLGCASVWGRRKGLQDFIELSKQIDEKTVIILVGLNDEQLKELPNNIIGIKRTENQRQLAELYSCADVFFNPTYEDNFPTTNLEALACGTPVVTYNTGGSIEAVDDKTGFIVDKGDIKRSLEAFKEIKRQNNYKDLCRQRAEKFYDKDFCFERYVGIYEKMTKKKS